MGLALVVGPAKAGKVARLLEGYLEAIDRDPVLIVPNRADVERIERDLLRRRGALLAGSIGTFDDVRRARAGRGGGAAGAQRCPAGACGAARARPDAAERARPLRALRRLRRLAWRCSASSSRGCSSRRSSTATWRALRVLSRGASTARSGIATVRRRAVEWLRTDLDAWDGRPVFAYGFEDPDGRGVPLEALAARTELTVSMPCEPGRPVFSSLRRTQEDLAALAAGRIEELPARAAEYGHPRARASRAAALLDTAPVAPALDGAVRFLEGAGGRGSLELVAESIRELAADGTPLDEIAPSSPRRALAGAARDGARHARDPVRDRGPHPLRPDAVRAGALALLRFEWRAGGRDLYAFLRLAVLGFARSNVDFLEGRLRGRGVSARETVEEETIRLRDGQPLPPLDPTRRRRPLDAVRRSRCRCSGTRTGSTHRPSASEPRRPPRLRRAHPVARRARRLDVPRRRARGRRDPRALEHADVRLGLLASAAASRCSTSPARTRRFDAVFLLGLEEERCRGAASPRRSSTTTRGELDQRSAARLDAPDPVERERYLFYTACTRGATPDACPRGGDRRGQPARAEPVLGRGRRAVRPRRGAARPIAGRSRG